MEGWTLHWLEAPGELGDFRAEIVDNFEVAYRILSALLPPPRLDILVQWLAGVTIPEMGIVGRAYRGTLFAMTVDPDNPSFANSLRNGALHRQIIHEVHHCLRMAGPGYGWTLGEALVSEGLAGQFVRKLFQSGPEPWERAVPLEQLRRNPVDMESLRAKDYNHPAWFYGTGAQPRWLGYTLGFEMVGSWLNEAGEIDAAMWVNVPAVTIIEAAEKGGLITKTG
ncbi:hypothetical protein C5748_03710 [Phyllobacterium phragmitis]|uniref:DUF2268 domain-containing protein n=1 Tax=Phyllobacterium phragmitis TaxID=2670329 RepID=A0A2S9IXQ4_9HYPH|nr:DUF2268 domain-containing putative Zn-dependent protease [Phyllobacterium phragmitis]PRD45316.1 hypothetical protein C5748_03710 [Phyllobacterium phragmitis]